MIYRILIFLSVTFLTACGTSGPEAESPSPFKLTYLDVKVKHLYDQASGLDSVVPDASILVYDTEQDRQDSVNLITSTETDSVGRAQFFYTVRLGVSDYDYFVKIVHPVLGIKLDEINTPPEIITNLDVVYQ
jgi:hypothetical protein